MKRKTIIFLLTILAFCEAEKKNSPADLKAIEDKNLELLYEEILENSTAYKELGEISKIGNRMTGTENGRIAEEFVFQKLKEYGYEPEYFEFPINNWNRENASLRISINQNWEDLNTISFSFTPANSHIQGRIVDVGNGLPEDFKRMEKEIKGNIALINLHIHDIRNYKGGSPSRVTKAAGALSKGAIGIVFMNRYEGEILTTGTVSIVDKPIRIPAVCVSFRDGKRIREAIQRGEEVTANIQSKNRLENMTARNVIARLPGSGSDNQRVVLGGHIDSWDISSGAMDNGIGSFAILDIARAMKKLNLKPHRDIDFIFWMGEEQGLVGSRAYIKNLLESGDIENIFYYVNIDLDGNPMGLNVQGWDSLLSTIKSYGKRIKKHHGEYKNIIINKMTPSSDNVPFAVAGIPVLRMVRNISKDKLKFYHSNKDNFHLIEEDHIKNSSIVMGMVTYLIANSRDLDHSRLNVEETERLFKSNGMQWELKEANHWNLRKQMAKEKIEKEKEKPNQIPNSKQEEEQRTPSNN